MKIRVTKRSEVSFLIRLLNRLIDEGEVDIEFGGAGSLAAAGNYAEAQTYKNNHRTPSEEERRQMTQLDRSELWEEAYSAGQIDAMFQCNEEGFVDISEAAAMLGIKERNLREMQKIWRQTRQNKNIS